MTKNDIIDIQLEAVKIVKTIKLLDNISWPLEMEKEFFKTKKKGVKPRLEFDYVRVDYSEQEAGLKKLIAKVSDYNAEHIFTVKTIQSYLNTIQMIHAVGSKEFQDYSIVEYGQPTHKLFGSKYSHLETAKNFLESYKDFEHPQMKENEEEYTAEELVAYMKPRSEEVFGEYTPNFILADKIVSKAAAGQTRVRLRKNAIFSKYDLRQLLTHEVFIHTLTAINGSLQPHLPLLGQGAPRTTKTQEGLATFAEVITGNLDLNRLKRISLRVIAIDMALNGADFFDLYEFFNDHGQSEKESFLSSARILRGGSAKGGIVFTKDGVYLEGLIRVHSLFRWAFKTQNLDLVHLLFCGRLDVNDVFLFSKTFRSGILEPPRFLPPWYKDVDLLAGKMAFSSILNGIDLKEVENHYSQKIYDLLFE